jgi:hypothetical protein
MAIDRRTFLSATLSLSIGGAVTLGIACRRNEGRVVRTQIELSGHFRDLSTIGVVGREALEKLPAGPDAEKLLELIAPERGIQALQREIQDQYARGETVELRGWPLALTEARIYAFVALGQEQSKGGREGAAALP